MLAPEAFRDVARPAHGLVGGKYLRQLFRWDIGPAHGFGIEGEQGGHVPGPFCDVIHRLVAIDADLSLVPSRHHIANQAPLPQCFDLRKAFLGAVLLLRPARTILEAEVVTAAKSL